ncbi:MAG TPA: hypothetical protein VNO86_07605, partial [Candidatus Binatia bacterium]|nr:hypothetical protein [Candidatus Binatia bacterium]
AVVRHSRRYSVRRAFGTRRHGGLHFGRGVPALLVYETEAGVPTEVYPHHEGERVVTVRDALVHILQDRRPGGRRGQLDGAAVARLREVQRRLTPVRLRDDSVAIIRALREAR